ncbi:MAG TPA: hypothetical protein VJ508_02915, partial [Saprospiraceae bacterium]|nr:hypothetical protein [Saprospiraceae bacterium]
MEHVEKQDAIETSMSKVLIEYKIPRMEALQMPTRDYTKKLAESLGIKEDASFQPILMPPSDQQKILMQKAKEDNSYYILRAEVKRTEIERIKKEKDVVQVWTDALIEPGYDYWCPQIGAMPDPANTFENVLDRLGVLAIRGDGYNLSGEGIVVGVLDGGITATGRPLSPREPGQIPFSTTSGTIPRVVGGWPNTDPEQLLLSRFSPLPPEWGTTSYDINDHGNMMAYDILRVAPRARLLDLRIARSSSTPITARISDACSAYDWAIGAYRAYGIPQIITCSWSLFQKNWAPDYAQDLNHVFTRKVEEAMNAGIIVLFNAGNCGIHCPNERCGSDPENIGPGHSIWGANGHPRVITVG